MLRLPQRGIKTQPSPNTLRSFLNSPADKCHCINFIRNYLGLRAPNLWNAIKQAFLDKMSTKCCHYSSLKGIKNTISAAPINDYQKCDGVWVSMLYSSMSRNWFKWKRDTLRLLSVHLNINFNMLQVMSIATCVTSYAYSWPCVMHISCDERFSERAITRPTRVGRC